MTQWLKQEICWWFSGSLWKKASNPSRSTHPLDPVKKSLQPAKGCWPRANNLISFTDYVWVILCETMKSKALFTLESESLWWPLGLPRHTTICGSAQNLFSPDTRVSSISFLTAYSSGLLFGASPQILLLFSTDKWQGASIRMDRRKILDPC